MKINYYAFGMPTPGRKAVASTDYQYGFNGKRKENEIAGNGNDYDFGARINDCRLGRWLSVDAAFKIHSGWSPYKVMLNSPIQFIDSDGNVERDVKTGRVILHTNGASTTAYSGDGEISTAEVSGVFGYIQANDGKTKLAVINVYKVHLTNLEGEDPNKSYDKWVNVNSKEGERFKTNCYGDALTDGAFLVQANANEVKKFLIADGYENMGNTSSYEVGDVILFAGADHVMEAIGKNKSGEVIWRSRMAGASNEDVLQGTFSQVQKASKDLYGQDLSKEKKSVYRAKEGDKYYDIKKGKKSDKAVRQDKTKKPQG